MEQNAYDTLVKVYGDRVDAVARKIRAARDDLAGPDLDGLAFEALDGVVYQAGGAGSLPEPLLFLGSGRLRLQTSRQRQRQKAQASSRTAR